MRILASLILIVAGQHIFAGVSLSHGIGEISSAITIKSLVKSIGEPDSIKKPEWHGKNNKRTIDYFYKSLDACFSFSNPYRGKERLASVFIKEKTPLEMDGINLARLDSTQIQQVYGSPAIRDTFDDFIYYQYITSLKRERVMLEFFLYYTGELQGCYLIILPPYSAG